MQDDLILSGKDVRWTFADHYNAPTKEEVKTLVKKKIEEHGGIEKMKKEIKNLKALAQISKEKIASFRKSLSNEHKLLLDYVQFCMKLRDRRKEAVQKIATIFSDSYSSLAEYYGISYAEASTINAAELNNLENKEFIKELRKRKEIGVAQLSTESKSLVESENYDKVYAKINSIIYKIKKEVSGIVAMKGLAKEIEKIVRSENEF